MWIKICGTTNLPDAHHAVEMGADALGFVFAPSARRVTAEQVRKIASQLPLRVEKYGVFVEPDFDAIVTAVEAAGLTGVQLHTAGAAELPLRLREHFSRQEKPRRLGIIRVLHFRDDIGAALAGFARDGAVDAVLVDSRSAAAAGGTGVPFDWKAARRSFMNVDAQLRLIAAGGLGPANVAEAIAVLSPWGVDAVTGLESAPGKKDPARVADFIRAAREAFARQKNAACAHPARA